MADKKSIEQLLEKRLRIESLSGYVLLGSMIVVLISMSLFYIEIKENSDNHYKEMDRMREFYFGAMNSIKLFCDVPEDIKWGVEGIYYNGPDYYCVNTKNMNTSDIMETDYHEMCHNLVKKVIKNNTSHFCEDE